MGKRLEFRDFNEKGLSRFIMHLRKVCNMEEKTVQEAEALYYECIIEQIYLSTIIYRLKMKMGKRLQSYVLTSACA